jgi:hypothetical protein
MCPAAGGERDLFIFGEAGLSVTDPHRLAWCAAGRPADATAKTVFSVPLVTVSHPNLIIKSRTTFLRTIHVEFLGALHYASINYLCDACWF